jgi:hypothetical protein
MQIRIKVEMFGDKGKVTTDSADFSAIAEGVIVGDIILPKGKAISVKMRNILPAVIQTIERDTNAD